jgi:DNA-binding IscR family transcriptional regulator
MEVGCALQDVWTQVRDATIAILDATTFADLAARAGGRWASIELIPTPSLERT